MKFNPRPYQTHAISFLRDVKRAGLFLDVGMGKSGCAGTLVHDTIMSQEIKRWLIVAPLRVCQTTWPSEIAKWDMLNCLSVTFLNELGDEKFNPKKREVLERANTADITVINIDNLKWLVKLWRVRKWPYDGVILDESSKYKDPSSKRFIAMRHVLPKIDRLVELTGSPAAQGLLGLWAQMYLLDAGDALGRTVTSYKAEFFNVDYTGRKWSPREGAQQRIEDSIRHLCMTTRAVDHLRLPETNYNFISVHMPRAARDQYRELERTAVLELGDEVITAVNAGVLTNKLSQAANGALYVGEGKDRTFAEIHKAKFEALREFVDEMQGTPFLLAYHFKSDKARLEKTLTPDELEFFDGTADQMYRWTMGEIPVLAVQPASAGHGVDGLQYASNTVMWLGPPWSRELYDQFNGRVTGARQLGTEFENVKASIHHLVTVGTVDETAAAVLEERGAVQNDFLNALRRRIKGVKP